MWGDVVGEECRCTLEKQEKGRIVVYLPVCIKVLVLIKNISTLGVF